MFDEKTETSASDAPTTHRFRYPGELGFPPVPVSFEAPLGWEATIIEADVTLLSEPEPFEGEQPATITFARDRVGAIATLDTIAAGLLRDGEESAVEFGVYDERLTTTDTLQTVWREQGLVHEPGDAPVVQIVQMTLVPVAGGVMQDLLLLVVTIPAERRDDGIALAEHVRLTMDIDG